MNLILFIKVILISIVEGITEFLPVSSTGHMILVENILDMSKGQNFSAGFIEAFQVIIQLGAILSVVVYFFSKLNPLVRDKEIAREKWIQLSKVCIAVIPAGILGFLFDDYITLHLFNPITVAIALVFYGVILIIIENFTSKNIKIFDLKNLSYRTAFIIGIFQCLAMVPGTSRSAATIIGGMILGLSRGIAAEFSFFLAIPTMLGATLLKVIKLGFTMSSLEWSIIGIGFFISFVVALVVIKYFMAYIQNKDFKIFGVYRIILGVIVILLLK